ncbi:SAM-dependent methyltransferase [Paenibacillus selenitireducens]|uniref:SAM-dependent methyltransferase n=1 Tax=Paenibacillus selenitireducens TaxID=1324314 RepID=A0A1T2XFD4_9BACL|nr:SAM-dependent methyltransferase [Paenibacillus selenitireducens]
MEESLVSDFQETTEESKQRWETNADFWDEYMGEHSNDFHRHIVRPDTERLLDVKCNDLVLDIACGNGNFSKRLVEHGASVVAFDYSEQMIKHARTRCAAQLDHISFHVADATDKEQLLALRQDRPFDKAVANMAVMDISHIGPLLHAVYQMLTQDGIFVFSTVHPCFVKPDGKYMTSSVYEDIAITKQPVKHLYYHRSLSDLFQACFEAGFVLDGLHEPVLNDREIPPIIMIRLRRK